MEIILNKEAPPALIQIIHEAYTGIDNIKTVLIDAFVLEDSIAGYEPETERVIIDIGRCLTNTGWMKWGAQLIPNTWLNLLLGVHHELAHACQVMDHPELKELDEAPAEFEQEANEIAMDAALSWFKAGGKIPPLENMGWLGDKIAELLNDLYNTNPLAVQKEMKLLKMGGIANLEKLITSQPHFNDPDHLRNLVDIGEVGLKMGDDRYLTGEEFISSLGGSENGVHVYHGVE